MFDSSDARAISAVGVASIIFFQTLPRTVRKVQLLNLTIPFFLEQQEGREQTQMP